MSNIIQATKGMKALAGALLILVMLVGQMSMVSGGQDNKRAIEDVVSYFKSVQNQDGGFPAKEGRDSNIAVTSWVIMALSAAGEDVSGDDWKPLDKSPIDYLKNTENELDDTTEYARILLALSATDQGVYYQGENLLTSFKSFQKNGHFYKTEDEESLINAHMWSIIAIASTGSDIPNKEEAKTWLVRNQNVDGGFAWIVGGESDSDDTGIAILTLVLLGDHPTTSQPIQRALAYLESRQEADGGFSASQMMGNDSNVASDAWVIQGLLGVGEDITSKRWTQKGNTGISHVKSLQASDGSFQWKDGVTSSPIQMSAYALMSLAEKPFPVNLDYGSLLEIKDLFTDFDSTHWSYEAVDSLVEKGVINGYSDGSFQPDKLVSRSEFTSMVIKGLGLEAKSIEAEFTFKDVKTTDWHYTVILSAYTNGIVNGKSSESFDPDGLITGGELATMLVNSLPEEKKTYGPKGGYWYSRNVALANRYVLLAEGFDSEAYVTRAECAYSIQQLLDLD